jgi:hypothetical protein
MKRSAFYFASETFFPILIGFGGGGEIHCTYSRKLDLLPTVKSKGKFVPVLKQGAEEDISTEEG